MLDLNHLPSLSSRAARTACLVWLEILLTENYPSQVFPEAWISRMVKTTKSPIGIPHSQFYPGAKSSFHLPSFRLEIVWGVSAFKVTLRQNVHFNPEKKRESFLISSSDWLWALEGGYCRYFGLQAERERTRLALAQCRVRSFRNTSSLIVIYYKPLPTRIGFSLFNLSRHQSGLFVISALVAT